jgi:predicted dehydrogenase
LENAEVRGSRAQIFFVGAFMNESESEPQPSGRVYGVGIIGAGGIFPEHARGYSQLTQTRIVALADVDNERMRRASKDFFIPVTCTDYRQLLERADVEIVDICTPPNLHEEMVLAALQAGKYVLCEKPLAPSLAATDRILAAAQAYPGRLSVIHQHRFAPEVRRVIWLRDEGYLGELQFGRFNRYGSLPAAVRSSNAWWGRWNVAGGGALMTQCIHEIDLMLHIFGPAANVSARMGTLRKAIESEDTFSATLEMESGAIVTCFCSLGGQSPYSVNWDVVGSRSSAHLPWKLQSKDAGLRRVAQKESLKRFPAGGKRNMLPGLPGKVLAKVMRKLGVGKRTEGSPHKPYFAAFVRSIEGNGPPPVPPEEARRTIEVCTAIYESAITHQPVTLPLAAGSRFYGGVTTSDYDGRSTGVSA